MFQALLKFINPRRIFHLTLGAFITALAGALVNHFFLGIGHSDSEPEHISATSLQAPQPPELKSTKEDSTDEAKRKLFNSPPSWEDKEKQ